MRQHTGPRWTMAALALWASACYGSRTGPREAVADDEGPPRSGAQANAGDTQRDGTPGTVPVFSGAGPAERCVDGETVQEVSTALVDKVDMLFVVDNSNSMREEQAALRAQFPRIIRALTTGDLDGDGINDFPPARDLHLGVVSSDMGLVGIESIEDCTGLGDDGVMNNRPDPELAGCAARYPRFLGYAAGVDDPHQIATDFGCIASLGTDGCGFEQPLEAGLKALWPSVDIDPVTGQRYQPNRIEFLGDVNGRSRLGHGDVEHDGFLRNDPVTGISLVAVIVVTDEEDCSSVDTSHFTPDIYLDPSDPLAMQGLNVRCFHNPQNLYSLDRYANGFKALRAGREHLMMFGAIAGVPADLVDEGWLRGVDFDDAAEREALYRRILDDARMIEQIDQDRPSELGENLVPSCTSDTGVAYPPRRIVELARRFGRNGFVGSICQPDFGHPVVRLLERLGQNLGASCLPRPLARGDDGRVDCEVRWHLPHRDWVPSGTPSACDQLDFLAPPRSGPSTTPQGGAICAVRQLAVRNGRVDSQDGEGWYYDDFSEEVPNVCRDGRWQRVAFTPGAAPPAAVAVSLSCAQRVGASNACDE